MTNLQKYNKAFMDNLRITEDQLPGLKYRGIPQWDSVGHMDMVADLEEIFKIQLDTFDVLALNTYEKGIEIMENYGVDMGA